MSLITQGNKITKLRERKSLYQTHVYSIRITLRSSNNEKHSVYSNAIRRFRLFVRKNIALVNKLLFLMLISLSSVNAMAGQNVVKDPVLLLISLKACKPDSNKINTLLKISEFYLFKPGNESYDINNALYYSDEAIKLSRLLNHQILLNKSLILKGNCYMEDGNVKQGSTYFILAIHNAQNNLEEAGLWKRFGDCIPRNKIYQDLRCNIYKHAIDVLKILQMDQPALNNLTKIGEIHCSNKKYSGTGSKLLTFVKGYRTINTSKLNKAPDSTKIGLELADVQKELADIHLNQGKLQEAESELINVSNSYKKLHYKKLYQIFDLLATVAHLKNAPSQELFYSIQCIEDLEINGIDDSSKWYYYAKVAILYTNLEFYDKAELYYKKSLRESPGSYMVINLRVRNLVFQHKSAEALNMVIENKKDNPPKNVGDSLALEASLGSCMTSLNKFKLAQIHILKALKLCNLSSVQEKNTRIYQVIVLQLVDNSIHMKSFQQAALYIKYISDFSKNNFQPQDIRNYQLFQYQIDSAYRRDRLALKNFKNYIRIRDSILDASRKNERLKMQFDFESEKKDKNILLQQKNIQLLKQQAQLQNAKVKQDRNLRNFTIICSLVMLVILLLLYRQYRRKNKANHMLTVKQIEISNKNQDLEHLLKENEWLLGEIHHRVKNNLQIIISLLVSQSEYLKDELSLNVQ